MQNTAANRRLVHEILATAKEINRKAGRKISFACAEGLDGDWQVVEATEEPEVPEKTRADKYWDRLDEIDSDFCVVEVVYESCKRYIPGP